MTSLEQHGFFCETSDGIITVTIDMPGPVNAMGPVFRAGFELLIDQLEKTEGLRGVIFRSGKKTFFAGGDIKEMLRAEPKDLPEWRTWLHGINTMLRRLERLPVPVVAAINGAALGGGLELCLACNHRIAIASDQRLLGLPEVTLGLFPGAGGVLRTIHLAGVEKALPLALEGTILKPEQAQAVQWVNEIVASEKDLLPAARRWIEGNPDAVQPWDRKGHRIPGGDVWNPAVQVLLWALPTKIFKQTRGLLPAPQTILSLIAEAVAVDFDTASRVQEGLFLDLLMRSETRNLMMSNFIQAKTVRDGVSRPQGPKTTMTRIGVLGAGMMGRGIAQVAAQKGLHVVLKDVSLEAAEAGKAKIGEHLKQAVAKGRLGADAVAGILDRIVSIGEADGLAECDLVIEAVFEDAKLKERIIQAAEAAMPAGAVFGSNTSTLPITLLAGYSKRPASFIGIHFFSPVDRMNLVEIIRGEETSDETVARIFDFVRQLGKTPIVVRDTPGFFTSRVYGPYMDEGALLVMDGVDPVLVDNLAKAAGMAVGPLTANDEVSLELSRKVIATLSDIGLFNISHTLDGLKHITDLLVTSHRRGGRHYGGGYYDYPPGAPKRAWPELKHLFPAEREISHEDIRDRLLFRQSVEALKCIDEGILSVADANIGSLQGIGAPAWTGGYVQFANGYGLKRFKARALELAERYGVRFVPPPILDARIAAEEIFE